MAQQKTEQQNNTQNYDDNLAKGGGKKDYNKTALRTAQQQNIRWRKWIFVSVLSAFGIAFVSSILIIFLAMAGVSELKGWDLRVAFIALSSTTFSLIYLITKYLFSHNLFR